MNCRFSKKDIAFATSMERFGPDSQCPNLQHSLTLSSKQLCSNVFLSLSFISMAWCPSILIRHMRLYVEYHEVNISSKHVHVETIPSTRSPMEDNINVWRNGTCDNMHVVLGEHTLLPSTSYTVALQKKTLPQCLQDKVRHEGINAPVTTIYEHLWCWQALISASL